MPTRNAKDILDFLVIGAQKAGTTSLFEYLKCHPELCLPLDKEAPYFSHDTVRDRGWDRYIRTTFASSDPSRKWGTITTHYMVGGVYKASLAQPGGTDHYDESTVPSRIHERLPHVRLIAILRDPVARAISHHQMAVMNGLDKRTFDDAIDELLRPESLRDARQHPQETTGYVAWGEYGRILAAYFDVFSRQQILTLWTEELENAPEQLLRRVHKFVGVAPDIMPNNLGTRYRESNTTRRFSWLDPFAAQEIASKSRVMRMFWHTLPESSRRWCDRELAHIAYLIDLRNRRGKTKTDEPSPTTLTRLRAHFEQDSRRLTDLLGESPPWHKSTDTI